MPNYTFTLQGVPSETIRVSASDAVKRFSVAQRSLGNSRASAVLITCETNDIRFALGSAVPTQILNNQNGDTLYWAVQWMNDGNAHLYFATSRSNLVTASGTDSVPAGIDRFYDGCSHTAGEEIGGIVIDRIAVAGNLSLAEIKEFWSGDL